MGLLSEWVDGFGAPLEEAEEPTDISKKIEEDVSDLFEASVDSLVNKFNASRKRKDFIGDWESHNNDNLEDLRNTDTGIPMTPEKWIEYRYYDFIHDFKAKAKADASGILIYRCIRPDDVDQFVDAISKGKPAKGYKGLGNYWTYDREKAICHGAHGTNRDVVVVASAPMTAIDIDWTVLVNLQPFIGENESEINLKDRAPLRVIRIEDGDTDQPIKSFDKPIRLTASSTTESGTGLESILTDEMMSHLCLWMEGYYSQTDLKAVIAAHWPEEFRRVDGPLYRGEGFSTIEYLKKGVDKAYGLSWTTSEKTAQAFAHDNDHPYKFIFKYTPKLGEVAVNLTQLSKDPYFISRWKEFLDSPSNHCGAEHGETRGANESEVLLKHNIPVKMDMVHGVVVPDVWPPKIVSPEEFFASYDQNKESIDEKLTLIDYNPYSKMVSEAYVARPSYESKYVSSWKSLISHTEKMFKQISAKVEIKFVDEDPYADYDSMEKEIRKDGVMRVWTGESKHPVWTPEQNWKFRAVHDYMVHLAGGHKFTLKGEMASYNRHVKTIPPDARLALFTEVVGQVSFQSVNNKFGEQKICKLWGFDYVNVGKVDEEEYKKNFPEEKAKPSAQRHSEPPQLSAGFDMFGLPIEESQKIQWDRPTREDLSDEYRTEKAFFDSWPKDLGIEEPTEEEFISWVMEEGKVVSIPNNQIDRSFAGYHDESDDPEHFNKLKQEIIKNGRVTMPVAFYVNNKSGIGHDGQYLVLGGRTRIGIAKDLGVDVQITYLLYPSKEDISEARTKELKVNGKPVEAVLMAGGPGYKIYSVSDGIVLVAGRKQNFYSEKDPEYSPIMKYVNLRYQPISDQEKVKSDFQLILNQPKEGIQEEGPKWSDYIKGEWWIDENGQADYADGDVGEAGHEAIAIRSILGQYSDEFAEALGIELDYDELIDDLVSRYVVSDPEAIPDEVGQKIMGSEKWNLFKKDVRTCYSKYYHMILAINLNFAAWQVTNKTIEAIKSFLNEEFSDQDEDSIEGDMLVEEISTHKHVELPVRDFFNVKNSRELWQFKESVDEAKGDGYSYELIQARFDEPGSANVGHGDPNPELKKYFKNPSPSQEEFPDTFDYAIIAKDKSRKMIGYVLLYAGPKSGRKQELQSRETFVEQNHRRMGVASGMYRYAEKELNGKFSPGNAQSELGAAFWDDPKREFGESDLDQFGIPLEEELPDGFEVSGADDEGSHRIVAMVDGEEAGSLVIKLEELGDDCHPFKPYEDSKRLFNKICNRDWVVNFESLEVNRQFRGMGIAQELMTNGLKYTKKTHPSIPVYINASPMDTGMTLDRLIGLYQKFGFKMLKSFPQHHNALLWKDKA